MIPVGGCRFVLGAYTVVVAFGLVLLGDSAPALADVITAAAALDFKVTFSPEGIAAQHKETPKPQQSQANDPNVTISNVPGAWAISITGGSTVYSLAGLKSSMQITDPMSPTDAWGALEWLATLTLTNNSSNFVNLAIAATTTPNLTVTSSGFSSEDLLQPHASSSYHVTVYLSSDTDPTGLEIPPGWDDVLGKGINLGDPAFTTAGADNFSVPLAAGASRALFFRINTAAGASAVPEPSSLVLLLIGVASVAAREFARGQGSGRMCHDASSKKSGGEVRVNEKG